MIYYRDPLLDKICDRILGLDTPAFIKNSELVYVAVNDAFAGLFNLRASDLVGTKGEGAEMQALLDIEDKERACLVFGEDQSAAFIDPFGKGRFRVEMERFTLADGQTFIYCLFMPLSRGRPGPRAETQDREAAHSPSSMEAISDRSGRISGALAEEVIETLAAGICIYDSHNNLVYFNRKLDDFYGSLVGEFRLGMNLREVIARLADGWIAAGGEKGAQIAEDREGWIAERLAFHDAPYSSDVLHLSNGRWIQNTNRRLPDGTLIGLRVDVTEMKEREILLEQHIEDASIYRELLNRLPVPAFVRGPDHRLAFMNQAYVDLMGRSYDELIGLTERDYLGDAAARAEAANSATLLDGTEYAHEEQLAIGGGRTATTLVRTGRLITTNGTPYVVGTIIDITEIHQREELLKRANEQAESIREDFANIVSSVDVGLIVLDKDLNILLVNDAYRNRIWGRGRELWQGELVGRSFRDLLHNNYMAGRKPENFNDFEAYLENRTRELRSGEIVTREVSFEDGTVTLYSGIKLTGGKFLLCYVDVSELRRRDSELARANEMAERAYRLMRNATDTMPEGLMVIEGDHIVFANPSLANVINVPEELLEPGGRWEDIFRATSLQNPENDDDSVAEGLLRFREAIASRKDVSYSFPLDGERWVKLEMRSREDGQSVILCSDQSAAMRREAELKRLIARAEAADRAKSEFLGNMGLEIRTPMNGILGMAELLSKSALDTRQRAFIEIIMKSGHALLTIINDILDFAKLDSGHMQLKYASFDPCEAVEDVASLFATKAAEKDIELLVKRSGTIPAMIMGDAGRFRQVITNLIGNAVKFTERGMVSASIGASSDGSGHTIFTVVVEDTGIGIPADKLATIFDKFSHTELTANRREGAGLGLAIAQRLAALQGGVISVHSTEKKGSTFTFSLPAQVSAETQKAKPLPANLEGARILIVDDHDLAREHLIEHATEWGFDCVGTAEPTSGMSILETALDSGLAVDAVVIDAEMPGTDGMDMARLIRRDRRFDMLAIIMMTSRDIAECEEHADGLRIEAYLTKPIRIMLLRDTLLDVIRTGRSNQVALQRGGVSAVAAVSPETSEPRGQRIEALPQTPYILVAEDNEVNQLFFAQTLEGAGMPFKIVADGEAAVSEWQRATPAAVLMDTSLPVLDGFEAARMIRAIEAITGHRTPIIGIVNHAHEGDVARCLEAGMDDTVTKPINPERLEDQLHEWTGMAFRPRVPHLHLA